MTNTTTNELKPLNREEIIADYEQGFEAMNALKQAVRREELAFRAKVDQLSEFLIEGNWRIKIGDTIEFHDGVKHVNGIVKDMRFYKDANRVLRVRVEAWVLDAAGRQTRRQVARGIQF